MTMFFLILFIVLYIMMCALWTIFCVRAEFAMHGTQFLDQKFAVTLNFVFAPVSLIMAIRRVPFDFSRRH
ncbi:MAG: hypothetical protein PHF86_11685 [Candidatus Nanoarchaeia archaeon]|nr:hypothetical protein [Candidatus Nanoarchaeia archaeon]